MKNLKVLLSVIFTLSMIWSCNSTHQLSCPDHSKNKKLQHVQSQAYRSKPYKAPKLTKRPKFNLTRSNPNQKLANISNPNNESQSIDNGIIRKMSPPKIDIEHIHPIISEINTVPSLIEEIRLSEEVSQVKIQDLNEETEKLNVLAIRDEIAESSTVPVVRGTESVEISDAEKSYDFSAATKKVTRKEIRKHRRDIYRTLVDLIRHQPDDTVKPVTGFAVSALVLGIISLFLFPFIAGPLAIIFGGIAMSRASKNPNQEGKGLAIAGLITGIVGTLGGLLILLLMI